MHPADLRWYRPLRLTDHWGNSNRDANAPQTHSPLAPTSGFCSIQKSLLTIRQN